MSDDRQLFDLDLRNGNIYRLEDGRYEFEPRADGEVLEHSQFFDDFGDALNYKRLYLERINEKGRIL